MNSIVPFYCCDARTETILVGFACLIRLNLYQEYDSKQPRFFGVLSVLWASVGQFTFRAFISAKTSFCICAHIGIINHCNAACMRTIRGIPAIATLTLAWNLQTLLTIIIGNCSNRLDFLHAFNLAPTLTSTINAKTKIAKCVYLNSIDSKYRSLFQLCDMTHLFRESQIEQHHIHFDSYSEGVA